MTLPLESFRPSSLHLPNKAQNGNLGSILVYPFLCRVRVTGLIRAFFVTYFQIFLKWAQISESSILPGEKPALLLPIG
jgi:hypothetical protein